MKEKINRGINIILWIFVIWLVIGYASACDTELIRRSIVANTPYFTTESIGEYENGKIFEKAGGQQFRRLLELSNSNSNGTPVFLYHIDYIYTIGIFHVGALNIPEAYFCIDFKFDNTNYEIEKAYLLQLDNVSHQEDVDFDKSAWTKRCAYEIKGNENGISCIAFNDSESIIRYLYIHREVFDGDLSNTSKTIELCYHETSIDWD